MRKFKYFYHNNINEKGGAGRKNQSEETWSKIEERNFFFTDEAKSKSSLFFFFSLYRSMLFLFFNVYLLFVCPFVTHHKESIKCRIWKLGETRWVSVKCVCVCVWCDEIVTVSQFRFHIWVCVSVDFVYIRVCLVKKSVNAV